MVHRHARRRQKQTEGVLRVAKVKNKLTGQQQRLRCYDEGGLQQRQTHITMKRKAADLRGGNERDYFCQHFDYAVRFSVCVYVCVAHVLSCSSLE